MTFRARLRDAVHILRTGELHPHSPHGDYLRTFWLQVGAGTATRKTERDLTTAYPTAGVR